MMKGKLLLAALFLLMAIESKSQYDTMYVIKDDSVVWHYAISDIDSIIFYDAQFIPDTLTLPKITGFVDATFIDENGDPFFPWGFNYTNPALVDLVEDYWMMEDAWEIVEKDFMEMKDYGANTVRIHLQYVKFMNNTTTPDTISLERLERLANIADDNDLYLIVTGLGAYRLSDAQPWYDELDDYGRWETIGSWTDEMTSVIRMEDEITMITVGLLPLGPINSIASHFDILSTHIYPNSNNLTASVNYVLNNQSDKPFLIEEFYNLNCSTSELEDFLEQVEGYYHGLIGHYMGKTIEEYDTNIVVDVIHKEFLEFFISNNPNP